VTSFYCITLESTPERTLRAKEEFLREGVEVRWILGIDGTAFGIKPSVYMHQNPEGPPYYITAGACALVLSHWLALKQAEFDEVEDFVIFEDDVILPENFLDKLERVKKACPKDSLAVWLEYCCCHLGNPAGDGLKYGNPLCTAAVWYRKEAIRPVLEAIQPAYAPVDILIKHRASDKLKSCVTDPQMCFQVKYNDSVNSTIHREVPTVPPLEIN
jgi:hypothetical protein